MGGIGAVSCCSSAWCRPPKQQQSFPARGRGGGELVGGARRSSRCRQTKPIHTHTVGRTRAGAGAGTGSRGSSSSSSSLPLSLSQRVGVGAGTRPVLSSPQHDEFCEFSQRTSPDEVRKEIQRCYALVQKLGRGVVYLGSSRVKTDHPQYLQALELAREAAKMLDCTTWTGAGPGFMDAAIRGAIEAKKPVGGFKIARESGEWTSSNFHPYLPPDTYLTCRFFSARKHGLVDAAVRNDPTDKTAVVAFPGGIGTLDEVFEILGLIQLERIGSKLPVPFLLVNYDSYYSKLLDFMDECEKWGAVAEGEVASLWKVCSGNVEALEYLAEFYDLPTSKINYDPMDDVQKV